MTLIHERGVRISHHHNGMVNSNYRQSPTFVHNFFPKTCKKVEMYENRSIDLYIIKGVAFPLL